MRGHIIKKICKANICYIFVHAWGSKWFQRKHLDACTSFYKHHSELSLFTITAVKSFLSTLSQFYLLQQLVGFLFSLELRARSSFIQEHENFHGLSKYLYLLRTLHILLVVCRLYRFHINLRFWSDVRLLFYFF